MEYSDDLLNSMEKQLQVFPEGQKKSWIPTTIIVFSFGRMGKELGLWGFQWGIRGRKNICQCRYLVCAISFDGDCRGLYRFFLHRRFVV